MAALLAMGTTVGSCAELHYGAPPHPLRDPPECRHLLADSVPFPDWVECAARLLPHPVAANRHEFAELYDPKKWRECRLNSRPNEAQCEPYRLRRRPEPEYWPHSGKVAPIKWPDPPKDSVYRWWMSARQYFEALCKSEAGEFIYRTVDNVQGIYQVRPRVIPTDYELQDRYVLNDPFGAATAGIGADSLGLFVHTTKYAFAERPNVSFDHRSSTTTGVLRLSWQRVDDPKKHPIRIVETPVSHATVRYGFTWRGISRPHDRKMGIAGGELAVLDLQTNEVLALHRGFALSGDAQNMPTGIWWLGARICSGTTPHQKFREHDFVLKVLRPSNR